MRAYADSSFILRLVTAEADSEAAIADYRRTGKPALFFLPLHALEVRNAILQRAFHQRRSRSVSDRRQVARDRDAASTRLEKLIASRTFLEVSLDWDQVITHATQFSADHTERLGARAIDLLHVACAVTLESELFLTTDARQAQLAKAEGLKIL